jgi:general secretion pathway protein G
MKRNTGFTLLELLITVAIVGLLASIALPLSEMTAQRNKEQDLRRALREIREALDTYKRAADNGRVARSADESGYPPSLAALVQGVPDAKSPSGGKLYFLRRVPHDPFASDPVAPGEATWGLRSFDSPPDAPRPGKDVFDVYTMNAGVGLNGIPYKEW